jgi:hypothetical protein
MVHVNLLTSDDHKLGHFDWLLVEQTAELSLVQYLHKFGKIHTQFLLGHWD